ncbi:MAG: flagellar assembly protein FliH [Buchnera aphidicola (Pentalonia nigronervosa)]|jgi:flagellar assembly protein FliH|uniref:Flagellar assembly protein FliH n=1 Tax=Buchnera aphidicola (Pentalonia nigronervosa) TaxID=1309793 RepID=A0A7H1AZB3_9GAMM|nr:MAG: flagellar assembly protein FliH [Buchnera aphidicola (Pentalonia nigronervosa)]
MSNLPSDKNWTRWYPKNVFLKNVENNTQFLYHLDYFSEKQVRNNIQNVKKEKKSEIDELEISTIKKEAYDAGFQAGMLHCKKENNVLNNKMHNLFLNFNNALNTFEDVLFARLLKIILVVSSYVIGKSIAFDEKILLKHIKNIIDKTGIFLKKPKLFVHPDNKVLIESTLQDFLNIHKWEVIYDTKIDLNSCQFISDSGNIDTTIDARWQELCRLIK